MKSQSLIIMRDLLNLNDNKISVMLCERIKLRFLKFLNLLEKSEIPHFSAKIQISKTFDLS